MSYPLLRLRRGMPPPWPLGNGEWSVRPGALRVRCVCGAPDDKGGTLTASVSEDRETGEGLATPVWQCNACGQVAQLRLEAYARRTA
jgi:hypothetical protein